MTIVVRPIAAAVFVGSLLCGCGGSPTMTPPSASVNLSQLVRSSPDEFNFGKWMYTAQYYGEDLGIYKRHGLSITFYKTLHDSYIASPLGTVATPNGWWYVANGGHSNVLVYRSKSDGPIPAPKLDDSGQVPTNVAVNPSRRLVAVSNISTVNGGAGSVSVYLDRQLEPSRTLTFGSGPLQGTGVTIDRQGNCYWAFNDPQTGTGSIVEFAGCNGTGAVVAQGIENVQGLALDQHHDLYYVDETTGMRNGVWKCSGTANCKLFTKMHSFILPVNINFDMKQKYLWVADAAGYIDAVDKHGTVVYTTSAAGGPTDPPFGIAPAPGG
jgi:DNA-binding beta-propeller fold protein YncE